MTTPSKETIDAALALAEAVDAYEQAGPESWREYVETRLSAYRATLPKLRTRAEVDASKLHCASAYFNGNMGCDTARSEWLRLCAEPTRDDSGPGEEP